MKLSKLEIGVISVAVLVIVAVASFIFINLPIGAQTEAAELQYTPCPQTDTLSIYSPKILISGIGPGGTADDMTLNIANGYNEAITLTVAFKATDIITNDASTGLEYQPTPQDVKDWVTIGHAGDITIPALSIVAIPVKLEIPKKAKDLPERWEFRIAVSEGGGFVVRGYEQRYLITMR